MKNEMVTNKPDSLNKLVNSFRPVYYFHTTERFYPCDFGDVMNQCSLLYKSPNGKMKEVIPHPHLNNGTLHADEAALETAEISLTEDHVEALSWKEIDPTVFPEAVKYRYVVAKPSSYFFKLQNTDILVGNLTGGTTKTPTYFDKEDRGGNEKISYENGFPFCPEYWAQKDDPEKFCQKRAKEILSANAQLAFSPNPQYCSISQRKIDGETYTDFIYTTFLAMNGSISILPGVGTHVIDVEVVGVRFKGNDISESSEPFRYYFAQHGGFSWYDPEDCEFMSLTNGEGANTKHLVAYFGRESHEVYPKPGVWQRIYGFANDLCNQGALWKPPAQYINIPTDEESNKIRKHYAQKLNCNPQSIILIPEKGNGQAPEWYYSVLPAHLPGSEPMPAATKKKIELPESGVNGTELTGCANATKKAGDHSEPGTYIDKAVPQSLVPNSPDKPCSQKDSSIEVSKSVIRDVNPASSNLTSGLPVGDRGYMDLTQPPGSDVLASINKMILPKMSGEEGLISKLVPKPLIDGYQDGWGSQSSNPYHLEPKDYPLWYHKENCVAFDLQVWFHSTNSLRAMHPGDEAKGYKGGIDVSGLENIVFTSIEPQGSRQNSFKLKASLPKGKTIKATVNAEIITKANKLGFSVGNPHLVCALTIDKIELEIECELNIPVAITDKGITRYCIDKNGNHTPEPTAIGWFVPNVQWAHGNGEEEVFEGITNSEDYCKNGLPPDAVLTKDKFEKLMNGQAKITLLERNFTLDAEFIGSKGGNVDALHHFVEFMKTGSLGDFLRILVDAASPSCSGWDKFNPVCLAKQTAYKFAVPSVISLINSTGIRVTTPPIDMIMDSLTPKLESIIDKQISSIFNHPPSL